MMEQKIGRSLNSNEIVHHINGDKHDNRIENLELTSRSEHMKKHPEIIEKWKENNEYSLNIDDIASMYKKMSISKIAKKLSVAPMTIWYRLKKANIKTNKRGHRYER